MNPISLLEALYTYRCGCGEPSKLVATNTKNFRMCFRVVRLQKQPYLSNFSDYQLQICYIGPQNMYFCDLALTIFSPRRGRVCVCGTVSTSRPLRTDGAPTRTPIVCRGYKLASWTLGALLNILSPVSAVKAYISNLSFQSSPPVQSSESSPAIVNGPCAEHTHMM